MIYHDFLSYRMGYSRGYIPNFTQSSARVEILVTSPKRSTTEAETAWHPKRFWKSGASFRPKLEVGGRSQDRAVDINPKNQLSNWLVPSEFSIYLSIYLSI